MAVAFAIVLMATAVTQSYAQNEKYRAKLDGNNEVPSVNSTGEGVINFKTKDGSMSWKMTINGTKDATGVQIHQGKNDTNGKAIVDLFKTSKHKSTPTGMILRGNITDANLIGSMKGKSISELKSAIANGDTYVNVKTKEHPTGEIRGQIKLKGSGNNTTSTNSTQ